MAKYIIEIEVDEVIMKDKLPFLVDDNQEDVIKDYVTTEFGWLQQSGITLKSIEESNDKLYNAFINEVKWHCEYNEIEVTEEDIKYIADKMVESDDISETLNMFIESIARKIKK